VGRPCGTDQCTQLHDRLVEHPGFPAASGQKHCCRTFEPSRQSPGPGPRVEHASKHSAHVGIDRGDLALERKTRHCRGGVPSDAWQPAQLLGVRGNDASSILNHLLRQPVQIDCAPIVAQPLPALPHHGRWGGCQIFQGGISCQKAVVVPLHPHDLGLLQHELGDHDVVRIAGAPPGKVAPVPAEPAQQTPAERVRVKLQVLLA
jgi:hypothetical protein